MSAPLPEAPVTEKAPKVVRYTSPLPPSTQTPLTSSDEALLRATSEPSKYSAHDPDVVSPSAVGVKTIEVLVGS